MRGVGGNVGKWAWVNVYKRGNVMRVKNGTVKKP